MGRLLNAKEFIRKKIGKAVSNLVSYDSNTKYLRINHKIILEIANRSLATAENIKLSSINLGDGHYDLAITTVDGFMVDTHIVPKSLTFIADVVNVLIYLPNGLELSHANNVISCIIHFVDRVIKISKSAINQVHNVKYDGKHDLIYSRKIGDFVLARACKRYISNEMVLPISFLSEHIVIDLSSMLPDRFDMDLFRLIDFVYSE